MRIASKNQRVGGLDIVDKWNMVYLFDNEKPSEVDPHSAE